jgi:hypothetical protein
MTGPDFLVHPSFGTARLTPGQKAHLQLHFRAARVTLRTPTENRYLADVAGDEGFALPSVAPAVRRVS